MEGDPPPIERSLPTLEIQVRDCAFRRISAETLREAAKEDRFEEKFNILDCRSYDAYRATRLYHAVSTPDRNALEGYTSRKPVGEKSVILYCEDGEKKSPAMAMALRYLEVFAKPAAKFKEIYLLENGFYGFVLGDKKTVEKSKKSREAKEDVEVKKKRQEEPKEEETEDAPRAGDTNADVTINVKTMAWTEQGGQQLLKLTNNSKKRQAVKVKCSDLELFNINPVVCVIQPRQTAEIVITRGEGPLKADKLVVCTRA